MTTEEQQNNKRIAKNTLLLYFRMLFTMCVGLYTSRIVLKNLGVEDFGIYNVVGGVVTMLSFFNGTLNTASTRFINVSLAKNDLFNQKKVFSSVLLCNVCLAFFVVIIAESIGLFFLLYKIQLPECRLGAAMIVYQISVVTVVVNLMSVPYNAAIIAHEKMKAFAYIAIFDSIAKLVVAFALSFADSIDKLILYALLLFGIQLANRFVYVIYCRKNFPDTKWLWNSNLSQMKKIWGFVSWSAYGSIASVAITQGVNILLNIFFGPVVNAARGIAVQVQTSLTSFQINFQTAINPQLMKSVATKDYCNSQRLLLLSSKYSFFLMSMLCIPFILASEWILRLWLGAENVPPHTALFVKIILAMSVWLSLANPLRITNQAEGNIKRFQIFECSWLLLILPLSYVTLKMGGRVECVFVIHFIVEIFANLIRIKIVLPKIEMTAVQYCSKVYLKVVPVFVLPLLFYALLERVWGGNVWTYALTELIVIFVVFFWGMNEKERKYLQVFFLKILHKGRTT